MPVTRYDADTLHDMRIQYLIVYSEVSCLIEKAKQLKEEPIGNILYQLKNVTINAQRSFNYRLEKLCGIMVQIATIILQDFSKDPEKIGIANMAYLLELKNVITNELKTCGDNFDVLGKVIIFLNDSKEAFSIISSRNDRMCAKPTEVLKLLGLISRGRYY